MNDTASPNTKYMLILGITLLVLGGLAMASPLVAGASITIVIGAVLVGAGIAQIFYGFRDKSGGSRILSLTLGGLTVLGGAAVLAHPLLGMTMLALILAAYFVIEGIWKIVASFSFRFASGWLAIFASGLVGLFLGFLIFMQWPLSGLTAVGTLVGVNLAVTGLAMLVLQSTVRHRMA